MEWKKTKGAISTNNQDLKWKTFYDCFWWGNVALNNLDEGWYISNMFSTMGVTFTNHDSQLNSDFMLDSIRRHQNVKLLQQITKHSTWLSQTTG